MGSNPHGYELYHREYLAGGKRRMSKSWWIRYEVDGHTRCQSLKTRDKRAAVVKAADVLREAGRRSLGLPGAPEGSTDPVSSLTTSFVADLERQGRNGRYTRTVDRQLRHLLGGCAQLKDVTPQILDAALATLKSPQTADAYLSAGRRFFRWPQKRGTWHENPATRVDRANPKQQVRPRRAFSHDEVGALLEAAPPYRRLAYLFALHTGLRRGEMERLRWSDIELRRRWVHVRAETAKSRREDSLPLPAALVKALRKSPEPPPPGPRARVREWDPDLVFPVVPSTKQLRADLKAADVEYQTRDGVGDFHAFRTTLGTALALANVPPALHQRRMRHSRIETTLTYYVRVGPQDLQGTAEAVTWAADGPKSCSEVARKRARGAPFRASRRRSRASEPSPRKAAKSA